ncbi:hypothetical protein HYQ45_003976 [Verticillium longisporum]|uniref:MARVEL domain-containing protein n=1 Tax=Verticillium longisporum TaxID=100787 RepID=A0A8I3ATH6_VERLO|nr:hypothetical protein HYQ45_003976 [Verticillium longisporum]
MASFANSGFFASRYKFRLHIVQLVLIHIVLGLAGARVFMKNQPRGRGNTIALGMGAKSLIIIFYQLATEHIARFRRWSSLKAFAIFNCLEIVFWGAVIFLVMQGNLQRCEGTGCILNWIVFGVSIVISILSSWVAVISVLDFRFFRANGVRRDDMSLRGGSESGVPFQSNPVQRNSRHSHRNSQSRSNSNQHPKSPSHRKSSSQQHKSSSHQHKTRRQHSNPQYDSSPQYETSPSYEANPTYDNGATYYNNQQYPSNQAK